MYTYGPRALTAADSDGLMAAGVKGVFSFSPATLSALVESHPSCGDIIYGRWNTTTCSTTDWDFVLQQGQHVNSAEHVPGMRIQKVTLFSASGMTYNTDFVVKG